MTDKTKGEEALEPGLPLFQWEKAAAEMSPDEVNNAMNSFVHGPIRGLLALEFRKKIRAEQISLESVKPDELLKVQGVIQGLRIAHGILQRVKQPKP